MPKVSVIVPSYNHEDFVREAIDSVLNQTYQDFEIVITDDGSADNTVEEIKKLRDERINLHVFEENRGAVYATNNAISRSKGEYLCILNTDDAYYPDKLEKQVEFLDSHPEYAAVFGFAQAIDDQSKEIVPNLPAFEPRDLNRSSGEWLETFYHKGNWIIHPTIMVRRKVFDNIGMYDPRLAQMPDFLQWVKLCFKYKLFILPDKLIKYRVHSSNASLNSRKGVKDRLAFEYRFLIEQYAKIDNFELLNQVFPKISNNAFYMENPKLLPFLCALAITVTEVSDDSIFAVRKAYGLEKLFDLLNDKGYAQLIRKECGFSYADLIKLSGQSHLYVDADDLHDHKLLESIEKSYGWKIMVKTREHVLDNIFPDRGRYIDRLRNKIRRNKSGTPVIENLKTITNQKIETNTHLLSILTNREIPLHLQSFQDFDLTKTDGIFEIIEKSNSKYLMFYKGINSLNEQFLETTLFFAERYSLDCIAYFDVSEDLLKKPIHIEVLANEIRNSTRSIVLIRRDKAQKILGEVLSIKRDFIVPINLLGSLIKENARAKIFDTTNHQEIHIKPNSSPHFSLGKFKLSDNEWGTFLNKNSLIPEVTNPYINMPSGKPKGTSILFALPFILDAGPNHLVRKVVKYLKTEGFDPTILTTLNVEPDYLGFGDGNPKYRKITQDIHHLYKLLEWEYWKHYIEYLIVTREIKIIYIIGCSYIYPILPYLKSKYPYIKIVDELFNEKVHMGNNRLYAKQIDLTIVENQKVKHILLDKHKEETSKVKLIESGVDATNLFNPVKIQRKAVIDKYGLKDGTFKVTFLGRLSEEKGPMKLIRIAEQLRDAHKDNIQIVVAGDGPMKSDLELAIAKKHLSNIKLLGMIDSREILGVSDAMILTSNFDGRPLAVIEAMAMRVPVIASNVGGLPDLIKDAETGFLTDPNDINMFVQRIKFLSENEEAMKNMGNEARNYAIEHFNEQEMSKSYVEAIQGLLDADQG